MKTAYKPGFSDPCCLAPTHSFTSSPIHCFSVHWRLSAVFCDLTHIGPENPPKYVSNLMIQEEMSFFYLRTKLPTGKFSHSLLHFFSDPLTLVLRDFRV